MRLFFISILTVSTFLLSCNKSNQELSVPDQKEIKTDLEKIFPNREETIASIIKEVEPTVSARQLAEFDWNNAQFEQLNGQFQVTACNSSNNADKFIYMRAGKMKLYQYHGQVHLLTSK